MARVDALVFSLAGVCGPAAERVAAMGVNTWFNWKPLGGQAAPAAKRTLLHVAAFHGLPTAVSALQALGADPNAASPDDGCTPLHSACSGAPSCLDTVLGLLLAGGAIREARDHLGRRPVDYLTALVRAVYCRGGTSPRVGRGWVAGLSAARPAAEMRREATSLAQPSELAS